LNQVFAGELLSFVSFQPFFFQSNLTSWDGVYRYILKLSYWHFRKHELTRTPKCLAALD
jgi:hypothetical protein